MGFSDKKNTLLNFKLISELITEATYLIVLIRKNRITKHLNRFHCYFFFSLSSHLHTHSLFILSLRLL
ncbi:hypothetical protein BDF21DRAFT_409386 [Thamnidium elegans]|nr:hypothetical protein BDF21DRAFT_409386 [Thamnidium elegans]